MINVTKNMLSNMYDIMFHARIGDTLNLASYDNIYFGFKSKSTL